MARFMEHSSNSTVLCLQAVARQGRVGSQTNGKTDFSRP